LVLGKFAVVYVRTAFFNIFKFLKSRNCKCASFSLLRNLTIPLHLNFPPKLLKNYKNIAFRRRPTATVLYLYLIVPFWYASAAYQASLVEPWFVVKSFLARRSRAKIPKARPNEPDILPTRTKKVRLGTIRYLPYPNFQPEI